MTAATTSATLAPAHASERGTDVSLRNQKLPDTAAFYKFRLYVADDSPNSAIARANLAAVCHQHFPDRHEIEIVDVFREPGRAHDDEVTLTPMIIKIAPLPTCRIVGTLCDTETLLTALKLKPGCA